MLSVIERARRYVAKCPPAVSGQGGHGATFHVAAVLVHGFVLGEPDALALLREYNARCLPPWSEGELVHKIQSAATAEHKEPLGYLLGELGTFNIQHSTSNFELGNTSSGLRPPSPQCGEGMVARMVLPPKPKFQKTVLARIANNVRDIEDVVRFLAERSSVPLVRQDSVSVLRHLYPRDSGEKILIFSEMKSQGQFLWDADRSDAIQPGQLPAGQDGVWFLPQPVSGEFLPNPRQDGKLSRRSEEAITAWRYAVLESDEADADDWLRCLVQMPLRVACICESGGRSIHALVRLDAVSKSDWDGLVRPIKPLLVTLGADPGALTAVRLSRLPQAMRGERCQRLLYLNPQPSGVPIFQQPIPPAFYSQKSEAIKT